ncbi:response regulator [Nitrospira sp. M1]
MNKHKSTGFQGPFAHNGLVSQSSHGYSDERVEKGYSPAVLIVDDDPDCREVLRLPLEHQGLRCLEAENGKSALEIIRKNSIGFIITDCHMPIMNGCDFLEQLALENPHPPPAILISGNLTGIIQEKAFKAGALYIFSKPYDPQNILFLVLKFIKVAS